MSCEITDIKAEQRRTVKQALRSLTFDEIKALSERACRRIIDTDEFERADTVLVYKAMTRECDPCSVERAAYNARKTVVYPLCCDDFTLKLYAPHDDKAFKKGAYGIIEPDASRSTLISPEEIDFLVIPALAFDMNCNRLGRGAGYYDRLLKDARGFKCGLCLWVQMLESVACEPHDIPLNAVACDKFFVSRG